MDKVKDLQEALDAQKTKTIRKETELRQAYKISLEKDGEINTKDAQLQQASNDLAAKEGIIQ